MMDKRFAYPLLAVLTVLALCLPAAPIAAQQDTSRITVLSDEVHTRGDWLGTYGSEAYLLCGMRAPHSLYGGPSFRDLDLEVRTGNPDDPARAWRSTMPAERNRTILWEPNGLRRTPGSFDDHGETYPLGEGPDLHVSLSVPEGVHLLSLYFFEIDWIQYRSYRIKVYSPPEAEEPAAETAASDFYRGRYKRFAVAGPCDLRIVIERGQSPNAIFSGLFLDSLAVPDLYLYERTAGVPAAAWDGRGLDESAQTARAACADLRAAEDVEQARADYLRCERDVFLAAEALARSDPSEYCRRLEVTWQDMQARLAEAAALLKPGRDELHLDLRMLRYFAQRAGCDFAASHRTMREVADDLLAAATAPGDDWDWQSRYLREYATAMMDLGRRPEAAALLRAYTRYCLDRRPADEALAELVEVGRRALVSHVPLPAAEALSAWEERHGPLAVDERLLAGALYHVAGRNEDAYRMLSAAEPEVYLEQRHRWCLVAMATSLMRMGRAEEAQNVLERLRNAYPGAIEADEILYQFGAHFFRERKLAEARDAFEQLRRNAISDDYKALCDEYLVRVERIEEIRRDPGTDSDTVNLPSSQEARNADEHSPR